ncbi:Ecm13p [Saccharomyces cerevisiae x Saccharomyces kudriavzevii VIN7]|uniref:Ecm13p n=1 Tax=Saccharomyces cerevisiae x Saccharomyces kudriavzevii (strain VIN7) TaxID=1095631 RepID=H0GR14_SACCK|nr:Ecm13p [Saccharomyces cerevisiae x Saccharomyces kudriavzevii VIN7]
MTKGKIKRQLSPPHKKFCTIKLNSRILYAYLLFYSYRKKLNTAIAMNSTYPSIEDQYVLAGKARSKLAKCIDVNSRNKDYNLRVLVGHANLLDKITENVEAHKSAANPPTKNLFSRGHENLSMEHIELSNARNNSSIDEENTRKADCVDYCEDYCDFYSSDEDPDADTLSSTDSEGDDDYEDYDFDYDYSCGDHNKKIDT